MAISPLDISLAYTFGIGVSATSTTAWREFTNFQNVQCTLSEDATTNTLSFSTLLPLTETHAFNGLVSIRFRVLQGTTTYIEEVFQVKSENIEFFLNREGTHRRLDINCTSMLDTEVALNFLRYTYPAQIYDVHEDSGVEPQPQFGQLMSDTPTVSNITKSTGTSFDHLQDIAFILSRCAERLLIYTKYADRNSKKKKPFPYTFVLRPNAPAVKTLSALMGDLLYESNDWLHVRELLTAWGLGVKFVRMSDAELTAKYTKQLFLDSDLEFEPELYKISERPTVEEGDKKYLDETLPDTDVRSTKYYADRPVPILVNPMARPPSTASDLDFLSGGKYIPDVSQFFDASDTDGTEQSNFWETFIGDTQILVNDYAGTDANQGTIVLEGTGPTSGMADVIRNLWYIDPENKALGDFTSEVRVKGVHQSPYVKPTYKNFVQREIQIIISKARRRIQSAQYSFDILPMPDFKVGDILKLKSAESKVPSEDRDKFIRIYEMNFSFGIGSGNTAIRASAYRLN